MNLTKYGWNQHQENEPLHLDPNQTVGRISSEYKGQYKLVTDHDQYLAEISGKMRHQAIDRQDFPAVGDWVVISARPDENRATIHRILPRFSKFSRKSAGVTTVEQIVAANMDTVFLVMALNHDFNSRRLERYLTMAWESGANPVIVLSKADLCSDLHVKMAEVEDVAFGVPILPVSAVKDFGKEQLKTYLGTGQTAVFLGSSGAGKSTLTNWLCDKVVQKVNTVREDDDRGRHTTTNRELIVVPDGGVIIDTPGMRELQLWTASDQSLDHSFSDIEQLAAHCRFHDCTHQNEPGCAVQHALTDGHLTQERYNSYLKLQRELAFIRRKTDVQERLKEKARWKKIHTAMRRKH
ncbi:ribosome small subunit-dependent GTPase A [Sporolactobacillus kofuensis]|uniref:Small ribosomal subunit biogenesis GTPase RsgA n=1 Tax=Sporolactobacillus kofuensis TaxID=269672 RepID=A0ABW1WGA9_9BACL|nr:ribosome small subunit-dependent GTPase A [Sporolactobacillus kofuensis]MCO7176411.1 ribosome small subunit-dependent GTPase A [Sporolactobacillus kofuensis]